MGTTQTSFHKGRYENHCGFINLKEVLANVYSSTTVRIRFSETRRSFCIGYLYPQTTTDRPPFVVGNAIGPITSKIGQRVVIIGPDIQNNPELIENYGHVIVSGYDPPLALPSCRYLLQETSMESGGISTRSRFVDLIRSLRSFLRGGRHNLSCIGSILFYL